MCIFVKRYQPICAIDRSRCAIYGSVGASIDRWHNHWWIVLRCRWMSTGQCFQVALVLLRFLLRHFRIIVSYLYRDISCACGTIYLRGTCAMQAWSIHHQSTQVSARFNHVPRTTWHVWLPFGDHGWAASSSVKDAVTAFEVTCHRWSPWPEPSLWRHNSQLPACVNVVAFKLVYLV